MTIEIIAHTDGGPYYGRARDSYEVTNLRDFIFRIRCLFEDRVEAILVRHNEEVVGLWLAEPDVDWDCDGYYEVAGAYAGAEYNLYRPSLRSFWNHVGYHFGLKYVPTDRGFFAQKSPKVPVLA